MRVVGYGMSLSAGHRPGHESMCSDGVFQASIKSLTGRDAPRGTRETFAAAATQSLLAVQENVTEKLGQRKRVQQGFDLLRGLDQLHRELLTGDVSGETVREISAKLQQLQLNLDEVELAGILTQIELRCAVELAKLSVGSATDDQSETDDNLPNAMVRLDARLPTSRQAADLDRAPARGLGVCRH